MPPPTSSHSDPDRPPAATPLPESGSTAAPPLLRSLALACAAAALLHALFTAWTSDWTTDEPVHLEWSERLLTSGVSERASQPWFNATTPVSVLNVLGRRLASGLGIEDETALRFAARLPTVLAFALLLGLGHRFLLALAGPVAASLWLIAVALDPNLAAHFSLATVDAPFALATLLSAWAASRFVSAPGPAAAFALGLALGAAMTIKVTGVLLAALVVPLVISLAPPAVPANRLRTLLLAIVTTGVGAWLAVALGYGFVGFGDAVSHQWQSPSFASLFRVLPPLPALFPAGFLTGIDECLIDERTMDYNVVILGKHRSGPVWYYFLLLWLVKTPLALLLVTIVGLAAGLKGGARSVLFGRVENRFLILLLLLLFAYFSFRFRTQLGYRFVLMGLPLVYALAVQGWSKLPARPALLRLAIMIPPLALLPQLPYLGNPLAFTNALLWDKSAVYRVVADSNLDWGQNDERVALWHARNPDAHLDPYHLLPGLNVIGANRLLGLLPPDRHQWLRRHRRPDRHLHHTHLQFAIDPATFSAFLDAERRLDPQWLDSCEAETASRRLGRGEAETLLPPAGSVPRLICLRLEQPSDLVLEATATGGAAGFRLRDGRCLLDPLGEGQQAWYRLPAGRYLLCRRGGGTIEVRAAGNGVWIGDG